MRGGLVGSWRWWRAGRWSSAVLPPAARRAQAAAALCRGRAGPGSRAARRRAGGSARVPASGRPFSHPHSRVRWSGQARGRFGALGKAGLITPAAPLVGGGRLPFAAKSLELRQSGKDAVDLGALRAGASRCTVSRRAAVSAVCPQVQCWGAPRLLIGDCAHPRQDSLRFVSSGFCV